MSSQHKQTLTRFGFLAGLAACLILILQPSVTFSAPDGGSDSPGASLGAPSAAEIDWYTIDGGGQTSSAGSLALSGTVGQPDAGMLTGSLYSLVGGFWSGSGSGSGNPPGGFDLHLPLVIR